MDAGLALVDYLYQRMKIDDQWAVRRPRGFTWWAGPLAQHIWAEDPLDDLGERICRVHVQTDLLSGFDGADHSYAMLAAQAAFATVAGAVVGEGGVRLGSSVYVHEQTLAMWKEWLVRAALIQVTTAHIEGETFPPTIGAQAASSSHPASGRRDDYDETLQFIAQIAAPAGRGPSRFIGPDFDAAERMWGRRLSLLTNAGPTGLTSEFPFRNSTSLFQMMTDVRNPRLGNGLLTLLSLPIAFDEEDIPRVALAMNGLEATELTRSPFLGSWCRHASLPGTLSHVSFVPNCIYEPSVVMNLLPYARARSDWAEDALPRAQSIAGATSGDAVVPSPLAVMLGNDPV
jgi:hypothetical protein